MSLKLKTMKTLRIKIDSEIFSCDVTLPEKKANRFLKRIIPALQKRIEKINACVELSKVQKTGGDLIHYATTLKLVDTSIKARINEHNN